MYYGDVEVVVIDEADTMFDRGFGPEVRHPSLGLPWGSLHCRYAACLVKPVAAVSGLCAQLHAATWLLQMWAPLSP